jgi:hypothetical protein
MCSSGAPLAMCATTSNIGASCLSSSDIRWGWGSSNGSLGGTKTYQRTYAKNKYIEMATDHQNPAPGLSIMSTRL